MKIAIMQPYFFPYIGYFSLIKSTDLFIFLDSVQYIQRGWIARNRILKPNGDWQYFGVPIKKHHQTTLIKDIEIFNSEDWKNKIFAQLGYYKKIAPYYKETINVVQKSLLTDTQSITKLNYNILKEVCSYLEITFNCKIFSEMNLEIEPPQESDEWTLNICKALGNIDEYINPIGGIEFYSKEKYKNNNIKLSFLKSNLPYYSQKRGNENFENGLSIIDVMMFNSPEQIRKMMDDYELI